MGGAIPKSLVYLDIAIDGLYSGSIIFELFEEECPLTCYNFKTLCTGELGIGRAGKPLCYSGVPFHRITPGHWIQGGDITHLNGQGGESCLQGGGNFDDENLFSHKHAGPGYLAMANCGENTNKSQFYIVFKRAPWLDGKAVVFGKVWQGFDMLDKLEKLGTEGGTPTRKVAVCDSGVFDPVEEELKMEDQRKAEAAMAPLFDDQRGMLDLEDECTRLTPVNKSRVAAYEATKHGPIRFPKKPPSLEAFETKF